MIPITQLVYHTFGVSKASREIDQSQLKTYTFLNCKYHVLLTCGITDHYSENGMNLGFVTKIKGIKAIFSRILLLT